MSNRNFLSNATQLVFVG